MAGWLVSVVISPFLIIRTIFRWTQKALALWFLVSRDALVCSGCGNCVVLVGRWECGVCRFVFDGFVFARCAMCGTTPPFVECTVCAVSLPNPLRLP